MPQRKFEAVVDDRALTIEIEDDQLRIDGQSRDYSFNRVSGNSYVLLLEGRPTSIFIEPLENKQLRISVNGRAHTVRLKDEQDLLLEKLGLGEQASALEREIRAPMPGLILDILVEPGQAVKPDDGLVVVEAMKMENELRASVEATITALHVDVGDSVDKDQLLLELETT